jgi:hypothetical protein
MDENVTKFFVIQTNNAIYVARYGTEDYLLYDIDNFRFDGISGEKTAERGWLKVGKIPTVIEKRIPKQRISGKFVLKAGFPVTPETPAEIPSMRGYMEDEDDFYDVRGLYDYVSEDSPERWESVGFLLNVYDTEKLDFSEKKYPVNNYLVDQIAYPSILARTRPCYLTKKETYDIIRRHVKEHIDLKYAKVTSDYDFSFTVHKLIGLNDSIPYQVNVNWGSRRKTKYETRYRTTKELMILNIAPKEYQGASVVTPFSGETYDAMVENIDKYLADLMEEINRPVVECPHCKGAGAILKQ